MKKQFYAILGMDFEFPGKFVREHPMSIKAHNHQEAESIFKLMEVPFLWVVGSFRKGE